MEFLQPAQTPQHGSGALLTAVSATGPANIITKSATFGLGRSFAAASIPLPSGHGCGASCRFLTMDRLFWPQRALNAGGYQWRLVGGDGLRKNEALHQIAIEFAEYVHLGR